MTACGRIFLPSVAAPDEENLLRPKTLLEHCKDAQEFMDEFDLNDGFDNQTIMTMRIRGHMTRMIGYFQAMLYHAEGNDRHGYLWTLTSMLRLVCTMANEAELAPVLSAACSLKHTTDMNKTFLTQDEAFDRAKQMGLTPDQAAREVTPTPNGRLRSMMLKRVRLPDLTPGSHQILGHSFKPLVRRQASQNSHVSSMIQQQL